MENIIGNKYSMLTVVAQAPARINKAGAKIPHLECVCECGNTCIVGYYNLTQGKSRSCGCLRKKAIHSKHNLIGQTFGTLTVISEDSTYISPQGKTMRRWVCVCTCSNTVSVTTHDLLSGKRHSCPSCTEKKSVKHGMYNTRLYDVYRAMKQRCYSPSNHNYNNYGARGIAVCDEWRNDFVAFYSWAIDNGYDENAPRGECTIDRIDVNGNYEPSNCRFITIQEQANNKRTNRYVVYNEKKLTIAQFSDMTGISRDLICRWDNIGLNTEEMIQQYAAKSCSLPNPCDHQ